MDSLKRVTTNVTISGSWLTTGNLNESCKTGGGVVYFHVVVKTQFSGVWSRELDQTSL